MITVKYKKNIDIDRMIRNVKASSAVLLNELAQTVKEGWDESIGQGKFNNFIKKNLLKIYMEENHYLLVGN